MLGIISTMTVGIIGSRLVGVLDLPTPWALAGWAAIVGWVAFVFAGMILPRLLGKGPWTDRLAQASFAAMGLLSLVFTGLMLRDAAWLAWDFVSGVPALAANLPQPRIDRALLYSNGVVLGGSLLLLVWGYRNARSTPAVRRVSVAVPDLPEALDGFRIAQLSDVHVGPTIDKGWLGPVVARTNAVQADAIVITGDLVDGSVHELREHTAALAELSAPHGVYFVTGNHEYYAGAESWVAEVARLGLRPLLNEHVVLEHAHPEHGEARLVLAGVTDYNAGQILPHHRSDPRRALAGAPDGAPRVLLAHQPRTARDAQGLGVALQLSGHTHGGQIWPWNHMVWLQQPTTAGLDRVGDVPVYTSRGTGYWGPPVRIGAPSEITEITLTRA
ncbi:MAG: metallophosphoesterase [Alphaproteobacteria bacterium]|nr:metallophosphoesterase [Alphaproteobacteria bacterium]